MDATHIEPSEFSRRRELVSKAAAEQGIDALLICSRGGGTLDRYGHVAYLTNYYSSFPYIPDLPGFWSIRGHSFVFLTRHGEERLVADTPYLEGCHIEADNIVVTDAVMDEVLSLLSSLDANSRVGIVGMDTLPASAFAAIVEHAPDIDLVDAESILSKQRSVKTPGEIARLAAAADLGSRTIEAMMRAARPGATHGDVVAAGLQVLIPAGGILYNSFMASGTGGASPKICRSSFPTWSSKRPLEEGDWLRLGISGVLDGYCFDVSRSRAIGRASPEQVAAFEAAIDVVETGISAIRPGVTAGQIASAGIERQKDLGFELKGVFSGLGHGIGMGWDSPWLVPHDQTPLVPGMVINVEKTLMKNGFLGDFEETVEVTEDGIRKLTNATKRFW